MTGPPRDNLSKAVRAVIALALILALGYAIHEQGDDQTAIAQRDAARQGYSALQSYVKEAGIKLPKALQAGPATAAAGSSTPGPPGSTGKTGATGATGAAGQPGRDGRDGQPGTAGAQGPPDTTPGPPGSTGAEGKPAASPFPFTLDIPLDNGGLEECTITAENAVNCDEAIPPTTTTTTTTPPTTVPPVTTTTTQPPPTTTTTGLLGGLLRGRR